MSFDELPMGWKLVPLEDAMDAIIDYRGKTPKKTESGVPLITAKIVKGGYILEPSEFIAEENYDSWMVRGLPQVGDVVLTTEAPLGETAQLNSSNVALAQRIVTLRGKQGLLDNDFLLCALQSDFVQHQLESRASGSTVKGIKQSELRKVSLPVPPFPQQKKISQILKALSNKLVCNNQINQTLEAMAQAIFKSWFVDFDTVKAKMNGEQPEGIDAETAALFPEKLDSDTGIPEGWSQGVISDIAKLNGKSWTKKKHPDEVHYVDLANTKNGVIEAVTSYDFEDSPSRARRVLNPGDTIVGTVRPGNRSFAYIGETEQPLTGSTGFAVLTPNEEFWSSFVYLATTNDDSIDEYARLADGGAYPAIKPAVVAETECAIPTKEVAEKFWQLTGPLLKKAHQNRLENEDLAALRDTLLPKLLSGELELDAVNTQSVKEDV